MSQEDRERWDKRWQEAGDPYPPHPLLLSHAGLLSGGLALDLACGRGQNAIWLSRQGYRVLALDISPVALAKAQSQAVDRGLAERVTFALVDLDQWPLPVAAFDLLMVFRFLDRGLFAPIRAALRPGGLLFYSTRHLGALAEHPEANEAFLLRPGELRSVFAGWHILHHAEGPVDAHLIARKPGPGQAPARSSARRPGHDAVK